MITQNPIIGRARKKLGNVYARTLYGKNVLQSCPPPTRGHQTNGQVSVCTNFGRMSLLSNQVSASLLNIIYYSRPTDRSRRAEWMKQLMTGVTKENDQWIFDPGRIERLGSNAAVTEHVFTMTPTQRDFSIAITELSAIGNADTSKLPCIILICPSADICIDLLSYTTIDGENLAISNLLPTLIGMQCYIFPLWQVNIGTEQTPVWTYGSFINADIF